MPEEKKKKNDILLCFEDIVEVYVTVFVNVLDLESAKGHECVSLKS